MPTTLPSACPLDCPDSCSLTVTVEDGRVLRLDGNQLNPATQGFICSKVRGFPRRLESPHRLLYPAVRDGAKGEGRFRRIGWDEALELVVGRIGEIRQGHGAEAILPLSYGGSNGLLSQDTTDARLFFRLGASRLARTVCAAPSGRAAAGLYGRMAGVAYADYEAAELIVIWGANPSVSGIHLVPHLHRAQRNGAKLVVVDPRQTPLAKQADLHLPLRPGTDLPVALALHRWLFANRRDDKEFLKEWATGVDELRRRAEPWTLERAAREARLEVGALESFARLYADSSPAVIRCGWGLERNRNGGSAVASVLALPAVAGKFGVRGGGYTLSNSRVWRLAGSSAIGAQAPDTREINMNRLGRALTELDDPPIELLFVYNANPLATLPNQEAVRRGLERTDLFTVVFDQVMTDTARYADLVLPATTFLEHNEIARGYGAMILHRSRPVVPPAGEARSNRQLFLELCDRLGCSRAGDPRSAVELADALLAGEAEVTRELAANGVAFPAFGSAPVQFVDALPQTPDGKLHLVPPELDREAPEGLYCYQEGPRDDRWPLALLSPATSRTISSTLGELSLEPVGIEIAPEDAAARSLAGNGEEVRVFNDYGEVRCGVRVNPGLPPGVAVLPKGLWAAQTRSGTTANALAPDTLADLGGGACFNDARVQIEKA